MDGGTLIKRIFLFVFVLFLCHFSTTAFAEESSPSSPDLDAVSKQIDRGAYEKSVDRLTSHLDGDSPEEEGRALHLLLRVFRLTGRYEEGIKRARAFLKQGKRQGGDGSGSSRIRTHLARFRFLTGAYDRALKQTERIIDQTPDHLGARWIRVRVHRRTGAYDKMETDFQYAEQFAENRGNEIDDPDTVLNLSRIRWMDGSWNGKTRVVQEVNRRLTNANDRFEKNPRLLTLWANLFREKHRDNDARKTYRDVLSFNKKYPSALVGMANIMLRNRTSLKVGDQEVYNMIDRALKVNSGFIPALVLKARQQMVEKKYDEAWDTISDALELKRNDPRVLSLKAVYHYMRDEKEKYEAARKNVHEINENYGTLYAMIARTLNEDHRYNTAQTFFERATERNPHLWTVLRDRGINEMRLGNEEKGRTFVQRAFRKNRFDVLAYNTLELLDKLKEEFRDYTIPGYRVRIHQREADYAHPYVLRLLKRLRREFTERYDFQLDEPTLVEIFEDHRDFSVRTAGIQGLGALGACFGKVSISLSPRAKDQMGAFNWGAILWHEMAHAYALQMSNMRVPRWFTEGLSTYEEARGKSSWKRDKEQRLFRAWKAEKLPTIRELTEGKGGGLLTHYLYGSVIIEFLVEKNSFDHITKILRSYGKGHSTEKVFKNVLGQSLEEVQKQFDAYLEQRFGSLPLRAPLTRKRSGKMKQMKVKPDGDGKDSGGAGPGIKQLPIPGGKKGQQEEDLSYDQLINRARVLAHRGNGNRAREKANRAKEKDPSRPMAYAVIGDVHYRSDDWTAAGQFYEKAHERGGSDMTTLLRYGRSLEKMNEVDRAITIYEKARDAFPDYVVESLNPYLQLFPLYIQKEQPRKAMEVLEAYTDRAHKDFSNHMKLASLYHDLEKWKKARSVLERMLYINYRDLELHRYLADAYEGLEQWKRAHTERHVIVALLKEVSEGEKKWDKLIAENLYQAARLSVKLDRSDRARRELKNARERGLSLKKARDLLQQLN